jgi:hypothetical protein
MPSSSICIRPRCSGETKCSHGRVGILLSRFTIQTHWSFRYIGEPNDAFWLAQAYFLMADYSRAEAILTSPVPSTQLPHPLPSWQVNAMLNKDNSLDANPESHPQRARAAYRAPRLRHDSQTGTCDIDVGPPVRSETPTQGQHHPTTDFEKTLGGNIARGHNAPAFEKNDIATRPAECARSPMIDSSMACRYLAALCLVCHSGYTLGWCSPLFAVASGQIRRSARASRRVKSVRCYGSVLKV